MGAPNGTSSVNIRLRRWLLDWHMYVGLLCAPYFVLYGVSTIAFNHDISGELEVSYWERTLSAPVTGENRLERARATRRAIGIGGNVPPWRIENRPDGTLHFFISRPGRAYDVVVSADGRQVRVRESDWGLVRVLRGMHGAVASDGIPWTRAWALYTDISIVGLFFAVASGLCVWWPKNRKRAWGASAIAAGSAVCVLVWSWLW